MTLTKTQEIEILRETVAKLGTDSYTGPWLASVVPFLVKDIQSDFIPEYDLRKAQAEAIAIRQEAEEQAKEILANAEKTARGMIISASESIQRQRESVKRQLENLIRSV